MYHALKNIQIVIALLKKYDIKHIVISPGSRNVPIVGSIENDSFFHCYSVVDERSAAFVALGLSRSLGKPVVLSCTSSTATSNYLAALVEAKKNQIPIIALTSDRDPRLLGQLENQMIDQKEMYGKFVNKSVNLPTVTDSIDFAYCERLVNEALIETTFFDKSKIGPVQINIPIFKQIKEFSVEKLPIVRKIDYVDELDVDRWDDLIDDLRKAKKIVFLFGDNLPQDAEYYEKLELIAKKINCVILAEHMSNIKSTRKINPNFIVEGIDIVDLKNLLPDIVISFGGNFTSSIKEKFRLFKGNFRHWQVEKSDSLPLKDTFLSLEKLINCSDISFFDKLINADDFFQSSRDDNYYERWIQYIRQRKLPNEVFSNFYAIQHFMEKLPDNSKVNLSILNSIRISNFFDAKDSCTFYANIGAYGIDGTLSTYLASLSKKINTDNSFLVIGDLSFLYDLNSLYNENAFSRVRIMLINNGGGGEFHIGYHDLKNSNIENYISAGHTQTFRKIIESLSIKYYISENIEDYNKVLPKFFSKGEESIIWEIITDKNEDARVLREYLSLNSSFSTKSKIKKKINGLIKKVVKKN